MFTAMLERIKHEVVGIISKVQVREQSDVEAVDEQRKQSAPMSFQHAEADALHEDEPAAEASSGEQTAPFVRDTRKVGRNEPCPCGSGRKYKQCHGKLS